MSNTPTSANNDNNLAKSNRIPYLSSLNTEDIIGPSSQNPNIPMKDIMEAVNSAMSRGESSFIKIGDRLISINLEEPRGIGVSEREAPILQTIYSVSEHSEHSEINESLTLDKRLSESQDNIPIQSQGGMAELLASLIPQSNFIFEPTSLPSFGKNASSIPPMGKKQSEYQDKTPNGQQRKGGMASVQESLLDNTSSFFNDSINWKNVLDLSPAKTNNAKDNGQLELRKREESKITSKFEGYYSEEEKDGFDFDKELEELANELTPNLKDKLLSKFERLVDHLKEEKQLLREKKRAQRLQEETMLLPNNRYYSDIIPSLEEAQLDFAFMFSAPLLISYMDANGNTKLSPIYVEVDHRSELKILEKIISGSNSNIKYRSFVATQKSLNECLNMKPKALHFCGHGVKNESNFFTVKDDEGDFLVFEDEEGKADFKSCGQLKKFLHPTKQYQGLDLVFVASCHSSLVGTVFLEAGAKHVVCIAREEKILDGACLRFTEFFYETYFKGGKTVCESFEIAKKNLRQIKNLPRGEENKFTLLKRSDHYCGSFISLFRRIRSSTNEITTGNLTPVPRFHNIPSKIENFLGRHKTLQKLISQVKNQRLAIVKGTNGIGKSSLCKELACHLMERNTFEDGIIFFQIGSYDTIEKLLTAFCEILGCITEESKGIEQTTGRMMVQVLSYLGKLKELLIIMDNIDAVYHNEGPKFKDLIETILTCRSIKIILTSRTSISGFQDVCGKIIDLRPLDPVNSRELFFLKSPRQIDDSEMKEFLENDYASRAEMLVAPNSSYLNSSSITGAGDGSMISQLQLCKDIDLELRLFDKHPLMQILGGHPQAISLAAALLADRSLKELYRLMTSDPIGALQDNVFSMETSSRKNKSPLELSLDASFRRVKETKEEASQFFGLLGLLPGGAKESDFKEIWGEGWEECITLLQKYSLVLKSEKPQADQTRYGLYPFMIKYTENKLSPQDREYFSGAILSHLKEEAEEMFNSILNGMKSEDEPNDYHKLLEAFLREEANIKACLHRELEVVRRKLHISKKKFYKNDKKESEDVLIPPTEAGPELAQTVQAEKEELKKSLKDQQLKKGRSNDKLTMPRILPKEEIAVLLGTINLKSSFHSQRRSSAFSKMNSNVGLVMSGMRLKNSGLNKDIRHSEYLIRDAKFKKSRTDLIPDKTSINMMFDGKGRFSVNENFQRFKGALSMSENPKPIEKPVEVAQVEETDILGLFPDHNTVSITEIKDENKIEEKEEQKMELPREKEYPNNTEPKEENKQDSIKQEVSVEKGIEDLEEGISREEEEEIVEQADLDTDKINTFKAFDPIINKQLILAPKTLLKRLEPKPLEDCYDLLLSEFKTHLDNDKDLLLSDEQLPRIFIEDDIVSSTSCLEPNEDAEKHSKGELGRQSSGSQVSILKKSGEHPRNSHENSFLEPPTRGKSVSFNVSSSQPRNIDELQKVPYKASKYSEHESNSFNRKDEVPGSNSNRENLQVGDDKQMAPANHLAVLYCSTLFLLLRFHECRNLVKQCLNLAKESKDVLGEANLLKISGCVNWITTDFEASLRDFEQASVLFKEAGCLLGQAICEAAIGYLKGIISSDDLTQSEFGRFENALGIYKQLEHNFGVYHVDKWLDLIKKKIINIEEHKKHLKEVNEAYLHSNDNKSGHLMTQKSRFLKLKSVGDPFAILLEIAYSTDIPVLKKVMTEELNEDANSPEKNRYRLWAQISKSTSVEFHPIEKGPDLRTLGTLFEVEEKDSTLTTISPVSNSKNQSASTIRSEIEVNKHIIIIPCDLQNTSPKSENRIEGREEITKGEKN